MASYCFLLSSKLDIILLFLFLYFQVYASTSRDSLLAAIKDVIQTEVEIHMLHKMRVLFL